VGQQAVGIGIGSQVRRIDIENLNPEQRDRWWETLCYSSIVELN
jgi:hypothetical protein